MQPDGPVLWTTIGCRAVTVWFEHIGVPIGLAITTEDEEMWLLPWASCGARFLWLKTGCITCLGLHGCIAGLGLLGPSGQLAQPASPVGIEAVLWTIPANCLVGYAPTGPQCDPGQAIKHGLLV